MDERWYWLGFSLFSGIGPQKFSLLLKEFGTAKEAWKASSSDLAKVVGKKLAEKFAGFKEEFVFEDYKKRLEKNKVEFVVFFEKGYPELLKSIKKPPFVLYYKGSGDVLKSDRTIGVVGTRKITQYGRDVTELFTSSLVASGFTIVSGLAMGVDAVAHKITVENSGKTIAVLGCGVDCVTPEENRELYNSILESGGIIVSELPMGHSPTIGSFPARNRIIAGLSQAVLVTEGAEDSGSLITAEFALEIPRPVFAIPGPITSQLSKGPFKLIGKGAKLVTNPQDILQEFQLSNSKFPVSNTTSKKVKGDTEEEQQILDLLSNEPLHIDEIMRKLQLDSSTVSTLLSMMEIKGMVKSSGSSFSIAA